MHQLPEDYSNPSEFTVRSMIRLAAAFRELSRAVEYANDRSTSPWEFAVEISCLRRLNVSCNDLRWLVSTGLINHAIETTSAADEQRNFKRPARLTFSKRTCFVLTPRGAAASHAVWAEDNHSNSGDEVNLGAAALPDEKRSLPVAAEHRVVTPTWDCDRQELRVGTVIVKRFRVPAASQEAILAAFEEESWPPRIDDPLPPRNDQSPKRRLQETIKSLNRNQKQPLIRFLGDGSAQGVLWEYVGDGENRFSGHTIY